MGVKSQNWKLDWAKFRKYLRDKYKVAKAFLFIGFMPTNTKLYTDLQQAGYILIFKPVIQSNNQKVIIKGNVDAELVLHTMIEYKNYEKAIIISGDGDFHCLVEYLERKNKLKKIIVPNAKYSSLLRKYSPYIVIVNLFKNKVRA